MLNLGADSTQSLSCRSCRGAVPTTDAHCQVHQQRADRLYGIRVRGESRTAAVPPPRSVASMHQSPSSWLRVDAVLAWLLKGKIPGWPGVGFWLREGGVGDSKLFSMANGVVVVMPRLAAGEVGVQDLVETHMETMVGAEEVRGRLGSPGGFRCWSQVRWLAMSAA